ncbi:STAS domain-containing protein [Paracoccus rhizosphaerae]|uniref:STAS domain-containing protein n=2 Tax=Paracoccus rhizosphaerae TaxID=1133347 RepID=A0ABV6CT07_9RHOB
MSCDDATEKVKNSFPAAGPDQWHFKFARNASLRFGCYRWGADYRNEMDHMHALPLPETFDRKAVALFAQTLIDHRGKDAVLDAASVSRIGVPAVELLVAARKQWLADGRSLQVRNPSAAFLATLDDFGASLDLLQAEAPA